MTAVLTELDAEEIARVKAYAANVMRTFGEEFEAAANRFKDGQELLDRFRAAIASVLKNGR
jgi:hypothetical protein